MVIYMKTHNKIKITTAFISLAIAQHAAASGYHFGTQSVGAQSTANAAAAEAADASTLFYNPAGLTHLDGKAEITGAINIVAPALKYHDAQASYYQGGNVQLKKDLAARYPAECFAEGIEGLAIVKFTVTKRGRIAGVHIRTSTGNALLDTEAVRAVAALPGKWKPGTRKGKKVDTTFSVPVRFALSE